MSFKFPGIYSPEGWKEETGPLEIYTSAGWKKYQLTEGFQETFKFVSSFFPRPEERIREAEKREVRSVHLSNNIHTKVLGFEKHRGCFVLYVQQTNLLTETKRYLVYGKRRDSDYGIGICLETVDVDKYSHDCDKKTIKYI